MYGDRTSTPLDGGRHFANICPVISPSELQEYYKRVRVVSRDHEATINSVLLTGTTLSLNSHSLQPDQENHFDNTPHQLRTTFIMCKLIRTTYKCQVHDEHPPVIERCPLFNQGKDCGHWKEGTFITDQIYSTGICPIHGAQNPHDREYPEAGNVTI